MNQMPTKPYSVRLNDEVRQALEAEAAREQRPPAQLAARAIKSMLDAKAAKRAALEAAVSSAEEGVFISSEAMNAWVDSWGNNSERPLPTPDVRTK